MSRVGKKPIAVPDGVTVAHQGDLKTVTNGQWTNYASSCEGTVGDFDVPDADPYYTYSTYRVNKNTSITIEKE